MIYAKINNNIVTNIIELLPAEAHLYPDCIPIEYLSIQIGDEYNNGTFLRNGEIIKSVYDNLADIKAEQQEVFFLLRGGV